MEAVAHSVTGAWRPDYAPGSLTNVFTPAMCQRLIDIAEKVGFSRSLVYGENAAPTDDPGIRGSDSAGISAEGHREYYAVVADIVKKYNADNCRFAISGLDALQVIRYRQGARFKIHTDIGTEGAANRKISFILQLSDPGDYEGGELRLMDEFTVSRARGCGCIFPSWLPHEVLPVTRGVRYSLVSWAVGDLFR